MKPVVQTNLIGLFGNQLMQYAFARAYSERHNYELRTPQWIGEHLFDLKDPDIEEELPRVDCRVISTESNCEISGYAQDRKSMIYSRDDLRRWFRWKEEVRNALLEVHTPEFVCHRRVGDYPSLGYVVVSKESYVNAADYIGIAECALTWITEEEPETHEFFDGWAGWIPDFYRITRANVIFRGNSTFSWMAANLSNAKIYSPIIDGLDGGMEHDCEFVSGNWPRFANLEFVTDLHMK